MTIKVFISGICGSQEVRKQQQRVVFILQSLPIDLQVIDITDPGREEDLNFMQEEAKKHDKKTQLPPQIFNDSEYCGDYADFELANDDDEIMRFLKLESGPSKSEILNSAESTGEVITQNGITNHGTNEDTPTLEEPISNGVNDVNSVAKEPELVSTEADEEINVVAENLVTDEAEVKEESEIPSKNEEAAKESSEEESEEESE
ncbi:SH3 domain-binding glutamic acid-rich protein homolog [Caerostris extrusa]|uniref:SH3 domain-binding glutamic acid-rich protein homolog n=1 Tax=Caerostris extrusa TaxID=172846 RepID=A0AAV4N623_CAEEX|nr:SH3 domain-binding glutamic acid-rich protein homolog [Caerostris extrusa]